MSGETPMGIDLGTTFSCVGIWRNDQVEIIANSEGLRTTPSYVSYKQNEILIGKPAQQQLSLNPSNTIYDMKRLIGNKNAPECIKRNGKYWTFKINEKPEVEVNIDGQTKLIKPEEVSAQILLKLKQSAENVVRKPIKNTVLTVPAYFDEDQKKATIKAAELAELHVLELISEPSAAAYAYGFDQQKFSDTNLLVFDLGGGTLDVVIIKVKDGIFNVVAIGGDTLLGGRDFDNALMHYFVGIIEKKYKKKISENIKIMQKLLKECIDLKHMLTATEDANLYLGNVFPDIDEDIKMDREIFDKLCFPLFHSIEMVILGTLKEASMSTDKIDEIILVGGSSRIAAIKELIQKIFPKKKLNFGLNPDEAIAYGATLRATQISQQGVTNIIFNESNAKWLKNTNSTHTTNPSESIVSDTKKSLEWQEQDKTEFIRVGLQKMWHQQNGQIDLFLKPMLQLDFITLLPTGLAVNVLSMLDAKSLCVCAQVSRSWGRTIVHEMLWRNLIERKVRTDSLWRGLSDKRGWKKFLFISKEQATYLVSLAYGMSKVEAEEMKRNYPNPLEFQYLFYRNLYPQIERAITKIENNWRNGNHRLQRINCQSKNGKGVYCLQYDDEKIVSGLRDNTIKIWNRSDLSCTNVLTGHNGSVLCLQYDDRMIVSGSSDGTVRIWDVQTGQQLNTLDKHTGAVLHLRFKNDMLVTCSKDRSIAVWDIISPQEIYLRRVLVGHRAAVNVVDFDQTYIVSASGDRTIKVWSADTCECVRTLYGHRRGIACLQYRDHLIVSGSSDHSIMLWDIESGACLRVIKGHKDLVRCIRFDSKRIISGSYDGTIKIWDLQAALDPGSAPSSICLKTLVKHTGHIFRLQFDEFQIVSGSQDDTILIWNFLNTGSNNHLPCGVYT